MLQSIESFAVWNDSVERFYIHGKKDSVAGTSFKIVKRWVLSLIYDGKDWTKGLSTSSIYADKYSVGQEQEETTGLPGLLTLWTLGNK